MERYNYQGNTDMSINDYISSNNKISENYLDDILEHPFIDNLSKNIPNKLHDIKVICYRINTLHKNPFIEVYLKGKDFISITQPLELDNIPINGVKRIKGYINYKNHNYVFIQIRNNLDVDNWITQWDIIINKCIYGEKIEDNVVEFFKIYNSLFNLVKHNNIISKPISMYCLVHNKYLNYVSKNKSVQYCQNDDTSIITLHMGYIPGDNVRNICFVDDIEIENKLKYFSNEKYYILRDLSGCLQWIFKDNNLITSYTQ